MHSQCPPLQFPEQAGTDPMAACAASLEAARQPRSPRTHRVQARARYQPAGDTNPQLKAAKETSLPHQRLSAESRRLAAAHSTELLR